MIEIFGVCVTILLCSPELVPQMTGGVVEGEVMVKVSVWHWPLAQAAKPETVLSSPSVIVPMERVLVEGPEMAKVLKSSLIWNTQVL